MNTTNKHEIQSRSIFKRSGESIALSIDRAIFRSVLGQFATGVTVVTAKSDQGIPLGVTVNAFTSLSLDPPLVLFCLDKRTASLDAFAEGPGFALNMLNEDQQDMSERFASSSADKFAGIAYEQWETGSPILGDCLANLDCRRQAVHEGGDHLIIVGRVERLMHVEGGKPLLYFRGRYRRIGDSGLETS